MKQGKGTFVWPNGDTYEGSWLKDRQCGQGVQTWANGESYTGGWKDDKKHGTGTYKWADGRLYQGKWNLGENLKLGKYIYPDGTEFAENEKKNNQEIWPEASYSSNLKQTKEDGSIYSGDFCGTKRHGYGELTLLNKENYQGTWKDDKKDGYGVYTWPDGRRYYGGWYQDFRHGMGVMTFQNGEIYEGNWDKDTMHGDGLYVWSDRAEQGVWDHGKKISGHKKAVKMSASVKSIMGKLSSKEDEARAKLLV